MALWRGGLAKLVLPAQQKSGDTMGLCRGVGADKGEVPLSARWNCVKFKMMQGVGLAVLFASGGVFIPQQVDAAKARSVLNVRNDPGGELSVRVEQIKAIRAAGTQVRIVGGFCNSACTMYLGLPNTCVSRNVSFGFHGPMSQFYGMALQPDQFEYWSGVMGAYYPRQIRAWYMHEARYTTVGIKKVSGRELIRLGIQECG